MIARSDSWVVAELALQIKDRTIDLGAPRIYSALLTQRRGQSPALLHFLALCLRSVDPSPPQVRVLTRQLFSTTCGSRPDLSADSLLRPAWRELTAHRGTYHDLIVSEIDAAVARAVDSGRGDLIVSSVRLIVSLRDALPPAPLSSGREREAWTLRADACLAAHRAAAIAAARADAFVRHGAVRAGVISVRQALEMPGGPEALFRPSQGVFRERAPYFGPVLVALSQGWPAFGQAAVAADLEAFGAYLADHPELPWLEVTAVDAAALTEVEPLPAGLEQRLPPLSQGAYLGAAALLLIMEEVGMLPLQADAQLGALGHLAPYLAERRGLGQPEELPSLLVPEGFKQGFRDWAKGRIDVTGADPGPADSNTAASLT